MLAARREHLAKQLGRRFAMHQRRADQRHAVAELADALHILHGFDTAFGDARTKLRQLIRELLQPRKLDRELLQVATVEPDEDPLLVSLARSEHLASERQILRIECL